MIGKYYFVLILVVELVAGKEELELVHVLFVHPTEFPFPAYLATANTRENLSGEDIGVGKSNVEGMTKEEKLITYNLGVRLRHRYNTFLGNIYTSQITRTRTTDSDISIMSAEILNAGLWPPSKDQEWLKDFHWQPVPTEYIPRNEDTLMMGRLCPTFIKTTNTIRRTAEILEQEKKYHKLFSFLSQETGMGVTNSRDIAYLYKSLKARASRNLTLPAWANEIIIDGEMLEVTYLEDNILSKTYIQQKLNGGFLLQKIFTDSAAHAIGALDNERKIIIYSGYSDLLIGVLNALGVWYPHVPNVASALIFEFLNDPDNETYVMKIFYDLGKDNVTMPLQIPGCDVSHNSTGCTFESLISTLENILPGYDQALCGRILTKIAIFEEDVNAKVIMNDASRSIYEVFFISSCVWILTNVL